MIRPGHSMRRLFRSWIGHLLRLGRERRAGVAVIAAIAVPGLLLSVSMATEIARWAAAQTDLQRTADMAALAGVAALARNDTAQQAANAAADVAELNDVTGTTSRSWNPDTLVLSDDHVSVTITNGVHNSADPAVRVAASQMLPLLFTRIITAATSISLNSAAMAELGPQPCILALGGAGTGVSASGNAVVSLNGCSAYSDSSITMKGTVTIDASALYASGTIGIGSNVTGTGTNPATQTEGVKPLADPYAGDLAVQQALAQAACSPTQMPVVSGSTVTLYPNTCYGAISISGSQTLDFSQPGLYTVNGAISVAGNSGTIVSGSGITIVSTGPLSISGNFNNDAVTLTAPTVGTVQNGAIPGVLFATSSSQPDTVGGNAPVPFTGLLYMPNAALSFAGTPTSGGQGCAKIIAQSVSVVGNSTLESTCSSYQLNTFGTTPNNSLISLVE